MNFIYHYTAEPNLQTSTPTTLWGGNTCANPDDVEVTAGSPTLPASATDASMFVPLDNDAGTPPMDTYTAHLEEIEKKIESYFGDKELTVTRTPVSRGGGNTRLQLGSQTFTPEELSCQEQCIADSDLGDEELKQQVCQVKCCAKKCDDKFQCNTIVCNSLNALKQIACKNEKLSCESNRAACKAMCACGEYVTPRFDPYETPGLGPIMIIRFCAVPPTVKEFAQRGRSIMAIESAFNEIYGVLDEMDKGGEL